MTIIEFYDPNAIHNALSLLLLSPVRVILFGDKSEEMFSFRLRLEKLIAARQMKTRVQIMTVQKKDYAALLQKLEALLVTYDDCVFDVTGGTAEVLVCMGALSQKHGVPIHLSDPSSASLTPFYGGATYPPLPQIRLSIREHAMLYGGRMTESLVPPRDAGFWEDVLRVWDVCRQNTTRWNAAISALHTFASPEVMSKTIPVQEAEKRLSPQKVEALFQTLDAMFRAGCFSAYRKNDKNISLRFRSRAVQTALEKEGSVLELYTYYAAVIETKESDFTNGAVGVMLDWDTIPAAQQKEDVKNEIDVFLMRGISPLLISCKNGFVDTDELYKLHVVASRFGGKYASCKIVLSHHEPDASFLARAKELGIEVIQNVHMLSPAALSARLN